MSERAESAGTSGGAIARAGQEVRLFARGENRDAIRSRGLEVREPEGAWKVAVVATDDVTELLPADLAIVAVKSYSLLEVAPVVTRLAEEGAVVLPLLNGVEAFESLAAAGVAADRMLAGLTVISAEKTAPGIITRKSDSARSSSANTVEESRSAPSASRHSSGKPARMPVSRRTSRWTCGGNSFS